MGGSRRHTGTRAGFEPERLSTMPADLTITVTRSGGFAGITREWSVSSTIDDATELYALVDACPWYSIKIDTASRDRFVYVITVHEPRKRRAATIPESSLTGPWKSLVQRIQRQHPDPGAPPQQR